MTKPKYFLYARKSTEEDDKQVMSIEAQLFELREFASRENLEIIEEFQESKKINLNVKPDWAWLTSSEVIYTHSENYDLKSSSIDNKGKIFTIHSGQKAPLCKKGQTEVVGGFVNIDDK